MPDRKCRSLSVGLLPDRRKSDSALLVGVSQTTMKVLISRNVLAIYRDLMPAIRVDKSTVVLAND